MKTKDKKLFLIKIKASMSQEERILVSEQLKEDFEDINYNCMVIFNDPCNPDMIEMYSNDSEIKAIEFNIENLEQYIRDCKLNKILN